MSNFLKRMNRLSQPTQSIIINFVSNDFYKLQQKASERMLFSQYQYRARNLQFTASKNLAASLSANQIGTCCKLFVINEQILDKVYCHYSYCQPKMNKAYFKPKIVKVGDQIQSYEEVCLSLPFIKAIVPRYKRIMVQYQTQQKKIILQQMLDFKARLFQHELYRIIIRDHLYGKHILNWRINHGRSWIEQKESFPKCNDALKQFNYEVIKTGNEDANLLKIQSLQQLNRQVDYQGLLYEQDFYNRLLKHFKREYTLLQARQKIDNT